MRIFLSYASEDRVAAEEISLALEGQGHEVFFDRADLAAGSDFNAVIRERVADADLVLFLITPRSVRAGAYALTELRIARDRWPHPRGRVLPVMLEPTDLSSIPPYLRGVTILEPEGNAAAEVAAHVARWRNGRRPLRMTIAGAAVVAVVVTAFLLMRNGDPPPAPVQWPAAASDFISRAVYPSEMIERVDYSLDPTTSFPTGTTDLVTLTRVAFGTLSDTALAVAVAVTVANSTAQAITLDLSHRFFELADNQGRRAELVYFCCDAESQILGPGEQRQLSLIFRAPPTWTGKETRPSTIYLRVTGLLPLVRGTWAFPPLATAA